MLKKFLSSQGTLIAFINMKIGKYFNMKILNIHNIFLAKSLRRSLPILQNIMLMSMECFPTPMAMVGISVCDNSPLLIFWAAGMCNGRERSGR